MKTIEKNSKKYMLPIMVAGISLLMQCTTPDQRVSNEKGNTIDVSVNLGKITQFLSDSVSGHRLSEIGSLKVEDYDQPDEHTPTLILDPSKQFQEIVGFGGALTDASAETFYKLPEEKQKELIKAYFDPQEGIGYSLCRTHMNSCDFSSESYAYSEVAGDVELSHFSIDHDKKFRIPFIKEAIKATSNNLKFFISPWSPPAWMKTNNNMLQGGKLKNEYNQVWADYFAKFIKIYEEEEIPIWGLTVQNEPMAVQRWESCIFTAEEERDFVKNFLGPTMHKNNMGDKKIIIWDHNRGNMYQRAKMMYDDPEAAKYVWGTGFHWYTGDHFENVKQVKEAFPDKELIFTEGCVYPFDYSKLNDWHWGERYGESIINDLNNSTSAWVDWNILLDETGGPNHVANYCYAPVIGNTKTGELIYMSSFYFMGHFSKFIRPGAHRIVCSSNEDNLLATAFINKDNSLVVVAMNKTNNPIDFKLWINGKGVSSSIPEHAITTIVFNN